MSPRHFWLLSFAVMALTLQGVATRAEEADTPVSDAELGEARGGFITAGGVSFDFGATLSTLVDGQLALQTVLVYQPSGVTMVTTAGAGVAPLSTPALGQLAAQGVAVTPGALPVYGVAGGTVALVQGSTGAGIVNVALNTGTAQTVSQSTALNLTIANGAAFQASTLGQTIFNGLGQQIAAAALTTRH